MNQNTPTSTRFTAGFDLGDKYSHLCVLDTKTGQVIEENRLATTPKAIRAHFEKLEPTRIAIETGTHSPWIYRLLASLGHDVIVANARQLGLIYKNSRKSDQLDAENLARLARLDPKLLAPIQHRSEQTQAHRAILRGRQAVVRARAQLIAHVRGTIKSFGSRVRSCSMTCFPKRAAEVIPEVLKPALEPILLSISRLSEQVEAFDQQLELLAQEQYPETGVLRQVNGVGPMIALTFVLTLESPHRFRSSRTVGAYLGLTPGRDQSGERDPQKRISKQGDVTMRSLLVQGANYILGPYAKDSDLRRHGLAIAARGGAAARKRAVAAVARKLAVLLHHLWLTGEVYEPLRNHRDNQKTGKQKPDGHKIDEQNTSLQEPMKQKPEAHHRDMALAAA